MTVVAILDIPNIPETCRKCKYKECRIDGISEGLDLIWYCQLNDIPIHLDSTSHCCPLRPLPEECEDATEIYNAHGEIDCYQLADYARGWNACLEEITGETK